MSELLEKQFEFGRMITKLLNFLDENGYNYKFGEFQRSDEQATINALGTGGRAELGRFLRQNAKFYDLDRALQNNAGSGIRNSLHELQLAGDIHLFKDGIYLRLTKDYQEAGEYWESIGGTWGGRFGDGNHFSLAYAGRK